MIVVEYSWIFYALFPIVAFLYAAVGHGGGSGYLALMALFGVSVAIMKPTALVLNLFVAGISFYHYYKSGYFNWKLFYPFAIGSIPAAFIGGYLNVDPLIYKKILGIFLIFAVLRMMGLLGNDQGGKLKIKFLLALSIGMTIGFFSGLIGIGGGIILSPILIIFHWANMKETAAVSALFIWINSLAGLGGLLMSGASIPLMAFFLVLLVVMGAWAGAYYGSKLLNNNKLKKILAFILILASIKLILT